MKIAVKKETHYGYPRWPKVIHPEIKRLSKVLNQTITLRRLDGIFKK